MNIRESKQQLASATSRHLAALLLVALVSALMVTPAVAADGPLQSPRLERAKDFIGDEQWERAIEQLKAAAGDPKERNKDEALFWLAHSQHQARDLVAAVETISRLEREFPSSRWVKPARSIRVEIAQKLRRNDVLWWTATPPPAPTAPVLGRPPAPTRPRAAVPSPAPDAVPTPPAPPIPTFTPAPLPTPRTAPTPMAAPTPPQPPMPSRMWIPEGWDPDMSLRIQALGSLIQTDAPRVIPMLKEIALESADANEARRAIFVLMESGRPEAQSTVLDVAKHGSEVVQLAAVRELGRFGGPQTAEALLQVYSIGNPRVKYQVVNSLGERSATTALVRIVETERDRKLQERAIVRLGLVGAREQLARFYTRAGAELKVPIIDGLFNARGEDELIRIADAERNAAIRAEVLTRLRLLGTEKTRAYLEKQRKNR
jgi:hypothetical protein